MNPLVKKLLAPRQIAYLEISSDLVIMEISAEVQQFADCPEQVRLGKDVRLGFPELVGAEEVLQEILCGQQACFELKGIARSTDETSPLYLDLFISAYQDEYSLQKRLIVLFEDATERMVTKQALVQRANEAALLLSALEASRDYIHKIIKAMADALLVTTPAGTIKIANRAAQLLFGYSEAELVGQPISMIVADSVSLNQFLQCHRDASTDSQHKIEVICRTQANTEILVEFSCSPIQSDGSVQGIVYMGRDITARKREDREIRLALAKEQELRELKSRFLSMVSHEFGNPLNTVLFSTALLKQRPSITPSEKLQYLNHIHVAAKHMIQLLNDLRLIGSAEAGQLDFNPAPLNLEEFCSDLIEEIKLTMGSKHDIKFTQSGWSISRNLPELDEKLLRHILTNLLVNALKYSPPLSPVHFDFTCQNNEVIFQITDAGIGIPLEDQKHLFESFYRAQNVGKIPGTGLGLAIVKQCVDLQGGSIKFDSKVGFGTTFRVAIPFRKTLQKS